MPPGGCQANMPLHSEEHDPVEVRVLLLWDPRTGKRKERNGCDPASFLDPLFSGRKRDRVCNSE